MGIEGVLILHRQVLIGIQNQCVFFSFSIEKQGLLSATKHSVRNNNNNNSNNLS